MKNIFIAAVAIAATTAQPHAAAEPSDYCPAATTAAEGLPEAAGAIRRPSAHKGDYLPARTAANPVPANDSPEAAINNSHSNIKSLRLAAPAAQPATCDHAINTKGTGAAGKQSAQTNGSESGDCDDGSARGLVTGQSGGTTNVEATTTTGSGPVLLREQGCGPQN